MPYADPDRKREYMREYQRNRYQNDPEVREDEAWRKARWYGKNREDILARYRQKRGQILPIAALIRGGKFPSSVRLRTVLLWCTQCKLPAVKLDGHWHSSPQAVRWFCWQGASDLFRTLYRAPRAPRALL